jgi:transglutaminase-like putative cysteine protease
MRYTGTHRTTYTYSDTVYLQPHKIRLRPRSDPGQFLHEWAVEIDPKPAGTTDALDAWGNNVTWAWFDGSPTTTLDITSQFVVDRLRVNPFDFIIPTQEGSTLPPAYPSDEKGALSPYFASEPGPRVRHLADDVATAAGGRVLDFATLLADRLNSDVTEIVRREGPPMRGQDTLGSREGSCRDLAVLYVEACRYVGIASRFVSGYVQRQSDGSPRELHAWAGVYIPGAGWRGFDPTQGLAVSTGHVTIATAASPAGAAPVTGTFLSSGATATLESVIEFDVEDSNGT